MKLLPQIRVEGGAEWLARTATQCLIDEARLSPKPGLVTVGGTARPRLNACADGTLCPIA